MATVKLINYFLELVIYKLFGKLLQCITPVQTSCDI